MKIDWSSLWKKEDWWAVWIGGVVLLLAILKLLPAVPAWAAWTAPLKFLTKGVTFGSFFWQAFVLFVIAFVLTLIGLGVMKGWGQVKYHLPGLAVIFVLALIAFWLGNNKTLKAWGLEVVLWALFIGLIISNLVRVPGWLKGSVNTEFYIKIGLVMLGAEILFSTIIKGGAIGMGQGVLVVLAVWFFGYWLGRRFGMSESFASVMASGVSICGVSAAIAAGGAVKGDPKEVSYVISLVLLVAMPMLVGLPFLSKALGLSPAVGGAWMGGTIDTTAAVVAAGALVDPKVGLQVASLVKMAQNVLIGFAAFIMAIWATLALERKPGVERPSAWEIWYRFPKFIVGFVLASVVFSFIVEPAMGAKATSAILKLTGGWRVWWFVLAFVCIGLDTRFKDLVTVGGGRPAAVFIITQCFNILWTLLIVWFLWSGTFFAPPL